MDIYTLDSILKDDSETPEAIIGNGILLKQTMLLITGQQKAKKTMLGYNLSIALARGKSFANFTIKKPHKVLILSAEGGYYPNRDRIRKMVETAPVGNKDNLAISFDTRIKIEDDKSYEELRQIIKERKPNVLVIDPFIKFHNLDENSAKDMGIVLERLRNLIEDFELSIILIHHLGKISSSGARGSSAISAEYDSGITIIKTKDRNKCKFAYDLRHAFSPEPKEMVFNTKTFWFEEDLPPIIKLLKECGATTKTDMVEFLMVEDYYDSQSGAYKAITSALNKETIYVDEKNLLQINDSEE